MEIERKYLIDQEQLPKDLDSYPHSLIEQAYLCTHPVVRIRRQDDSFILTYKGSGMMSREEYNLPLTKDAYAHLLKKADGTIITKTRYRIPMKDTGLTIELDLFAGKWDGLILAEVEFPDLEGAQHFLPPAWFGEDVTFQEQYHNSWMSCH